MVNRKKRVIVVVSVVRDKFFAGVQVPFLEKEANLSIRPNPDGRINRKQNGCIFEETAE